MSTISLMYCNCFLILNHLSHSPPSMVLSRYIAVPTDIGVRKGGGQEGLKPPMICTQTIYTKYYEQEQLNHVMLLHTHKDRTDK